MNENVFIVILNWNGKNDVMECLGSVSKIDYPCYEVIVVDNGSKDGSVEAIRAAFPSITIVENKENRGFAEGNNVGIKHALDNGACFILLLNNDTVVDSAILSELLNAFHTVKNPGFLGCKSYFYDRPTVLQHFGGTYDTVGILKGRHTGEGEADSTKFGEVSSCDYVSGCAIFAHKSLLDEVGLLDSRFFMYWEDGDWCMRAKAAGFINYVVPGARLWHKVTASTGGGSAVTAFYSSRNRVLFAMKHGYRVRLVRWSYHLAKGVLKTKWDQRVSAAVYILAGHLAGTLGIGGRMSALLERNTMGHIERRLRSGFNYYGKVTKQFVARFRVVH